MPLPAVMHGCGHALLPGRRTPCAGFLGVEVTGSPSAPVSALVAEVWQPTAAD